MTPEQKRIKELEARVAELEWRMADLLGAEKVAPIGISRPKFQIGELLARRAPMIVSTSALHQVAVIDLMDVIDPDNILKVQLSRMRAALRAYGFEIETVRGVGYRMTPDNAAKWRALVAKYNPQMEDAA